MNGKASNNHRSSKARAKPWTGSDRPPAGQPAHEYSRTQELINNLPYAAMTVLGATVFVVGFGNSARGWVAASAYLMYGMVGALWVMVFICPYCEYWNTRTCPCGYGRIAARLRKKKDGDRFKEKFKKHIPAIVPLWLIPILAGVLLAVYSFSWPLLVLLVVFALDAFIVLPLFSREHGCAACPQKDSCPWMESKG